MLGLGSSILHEDSHIKLSDVTGYPKVNFKEPLVPENVTALDDPAKPPLAERENDVDDGDTSCLGRILYSFIVLYRGMRTYKKYDVFRAGLSLAFLYLTVLGFDGITVGMYGFLSSLFQARTDNSFQLTPSLSWSLH